MHGYANMIPRTAMRADIPYKNWRLALFEVLTALLAQYSAIKPASVLFVYALCGKKCYLALFANAVPYL